jgi:hypothetical protein
MKKLFFTLILTAALGGSTALAQDQAKHPPVPDYLNDVVVAISTYRRKKPCA